MAGNDPDFTGNAVRLYGQMAVILGWRPAEFWAATPAELGSIIAAMTSQTDMGRGMGRNECNDLMEQFPDG